MEARLEKPEEREEGEYNKYYNIIYNMITKGKPVVKSQVKPVVKPVVTPVVEPCAIDKDELNQMVSEIQITIDAYASLLSGNFQNLQPFFKSLDDNNSLTDENKKHILGLITDIESLNGGLFALQERLQNINGLTNENTYNTEKLQDSVDDFLSKNKENFDETLKNNLYDVDLGEGQGGGRKSRKTRKSRKQRKTRR